MKCSKCGKTIPSDKSLCVACEMDDDIDMMPEELAMAEELLKEMTPEMLDELKSAFNESGSAEEFANRIMVGPCPKCGSDNTSHWGDDPEIDDISVSRCKECGQLWCSLCEKPLDKSSPICKQCE